MSAATCPEPTPAERARSVLAAAGSLTVTTQGHRIELIGLHTVDAAARLLLHNPPDGHLAAELAVAPHGDLAALVEFTDVAAVAVRERVRARLTLGGWLSALGPKTLVFHPARAVLTEDGGTALIGLDELTLASPDPLATHEAEMLGRLDAAHADTVAPLARLLPPGSSSARPAYGHCGSTGTAWCSGWRRRTPTTTSACPSRPRPPTRETRCARSTRCSPGPPPARVAGACRPGRRRGHAPYCRPPGHSQRPSRLLREGARRPAHSRLPDSSRSVVRMSESVNGCRGSVRIRCAEPCSTSSPASSTAMR